MAKPTFTRPSQGHLIAFDFLMKSNKPFTSLEFIEGCNQLSPHGQEIKPPTGRSYLNAFTECGILETSAQYPANVWYLKDGWEKTPEAQRLKSAYYYDN